MELSKLSRIKGIKRKGKIIGRGIGSGKGGHTVGKGNKGQNARKGAKPGLGFEGGQVPLYKRLPKLGGFRSNNFIKYTEISLSAFNKFKNDTEVTPVDLLKQKIVKNLSKRGVKILAKGSLEKKLTFKGFSYTKGALEAINKSGSVTK